MAGTTPSVGALSPAPAAQGTGNPAALPFTQGDYVQAPNQGNLQQRGNMGNAVGEFYNDYKRAQVDNITQASTLAKAARDRLTQIWQSGAQNDQVQNNPKVHKQIAQLYKAMGVTPPVNEKGQLDWNAMAPAKTMNELSPQLMEQLQEAQPAQRRAMARSMHLIDADEGFLGAPAKATQQRLQAFDKELQTTLMGAKTGGMGPAAFKAFVTANKNLIDQSHGDGAADQLLQSPEVFNDLQRNTQAALQLQTDTLAKIEAETKKLKVKTAEMPAESKARITQDLANAKRATTLSDLDVIKSKIGAVQLKDMPGIDAAKIRELNATSDAKAQTAQHLMMMVDEMKKTGKGTSTGEINTALTQATREYATAAGAYKSAAASGLGVPEDIQKAYTDSQTLVDTLTTARDNLSSPDTQKAIAAAKVQNLTGNHAVPTVGSKPYQWVRAGVDKKNNPVGLGRDGKSYVQSNGLPAVTQ